MNTQGFNYRTGKAAMRALEANGWTHIVTVMSDQGSKSLHFGMLYTKDGKEFWLNKNTYANLPE